jgi:hypothetical protein
MKPPPAHGLVNRLIALTLLLLVFAGSLGLGAVWARQGISSAANRNRALEGRLADVERRLDEVNAQVATAVNPDVLLKQNQAMRLGLATPLETQVVRVDISPEIKLLQKRNSEVFSIASASAAAGSAPSFRVLTASLR